MTRQPGFLRVTRAYAVTIAGAVALGLGLSMFQAQEWPPSDLGTWLWGSVYGVAIRVGPDLVQYIGYVQRRWGVESLPAERAPPVEVIGDGEGRY